MRSGALAQHYSLKTDDELLALAADYGSLADEAQSLLAAELRRRNLEAPISTSIETKTHRLWDRPIAKFFRVVGTLLLNLGVAIFGTGSIESFIWSRIGPSRSLFEVEAREWLLSVSIAALLGFLVSRRWQNKAAMWVWVVPVAFLAFRALLYATNKGSISVWEHFFAPNCLNDRAECRDFLLFTTSAARTVAYSLVIWVSARLETLPKKTDVP